MTDREPDSDPSATVPPPDYGRLDDTAARADLGRLVREMRRTLTIVADDVRLLREERARSEGSAKVWRAGGGIAATVALAIAGWAVTLGSQASADHDRVTRHEAMLEDLDDDSDDIRESLARVEALLDQRNPPPRREESEER